MRTMLVANRKGGCGKTMAAITIAGGLAARGGAVALADADPQKSALRWLKHRPADGRRRSPGSTGPNRATSATCRAATAGW